MKGAAIASIAVALALAWTELAWGDVCPPPGESWLRVAFAGDGFTPSLRARVIEQLGAEFRGHGLALCEGADAPATSPPLADIALALSADSVLSLEVRDAVTDKQITRELRLGSVPRDALALSITLAAEELVHASWIEAALAPPPSPSAPPGPRPLPAPVRAVNAEEIARMPQARETAGSARPADGGASAQAHPWMAEVALLGAGEWSSGGQTDLGGDARFALGGRLAIGARLGFRLAPDVTSHHGTVQGRELLAGLGVTYALVRRDATWGGDVGVRAELIDVQFSGVPASRTEVAGIVTEGMHGAALGATVSGTLGGWVRVGGPWRIVADAAVGAPVHAVTASDSGTTATGVSGLTIGLALGVGATLPD
jgi:hypothetical protein